MANGIANGYPNLSRYIGGILQSMIILLLIYFGSNVIDNGVAIAVINTKLDSVVKSGDDYDDRIRSLESQRYRSYSLNEESD